MEIFTLLHVLEELDADINALCIQRAEAEIDGCILDRYNQKIHVLASVRERVQKQLEKENDDYSAYLFNRGEG